MTDFDLRSTTLRVLECSACDEPVCGEPDGVEVTLRCGYCGFEDVRKLARTFASAEAAEARTPYRGRKAGESQRLRVDLSQRPDGTSRWIKAVDLRARYLAAKRAEVPERRADSEGDAGGRAEQGRRDAEFRLLHLGATLAAHQIGRGDFLHARALLETLLERLSIPVYRALVLARLAALAGAIDLGEKWLRACPANLRVPEVTSDRRVAAAMIARYRGDPRGVLDAIGQGDTADEFVGNARWIAVALRVDAHEALGQQAFADKVWRTGARRGAIPLGVAARTFGLAQDTRRRALSRRWGLLCLCVILLVAMARLGTREADPHPWSSWIVGAWCVVGLVWASLVLFRHPRPATSTVDPKETSPPRV